MRPPLRRSDTDKVLAGVASGFARWLGIDPVIVRVVLVVLAVFGGSGLLLYAIGWLFIPAESSAESEAERFLREGRRDRSVGRMILIVLLVVLAIGLATSVLSALSFGPLGHWGGGGALLLIAAAAIVVLYLVRRPYHGTLPSSATPAPAPAPAPAPEPAPVSSPWAGAAAYTETSPPPTAFAYGGSGQYPGYTAPTTPAPLPPRPRSFLGLATLSVAIIVTGLLAALSASGVANIPAVVVLAPTLGILGLGLLVGAFAGRARWLVFLALPLLLVTALVAALPQDLGSRMSHGIGSRTWTPLSSSDLADNYELGVGNVSLDLTSLSLPAAASRAVTVTVGVGQVRVWVPMNMRVYVNAGVDTGHIGINDLTMVTSPSVPSIGPDGNAQAVPQPSGFVSTSVVDRSGRRISAHVALPGNPSSGPTITLNLNSSVGNVEVDREPASS